MSELRKKELVDQVFKAGNLDTELSTWVRQVFSFLKSKYPKVEQSQWEVIGEKFGDIAYLVEAKKVYMDVFSEKELEEIIKFWTSDTGRKLIRGSFMSNFIQFNEAWGHSIEDACKVSVLEA